MEDKIRQFVATVLGISSDEVNADLTREGCEKWDSVNHLRLISMIERECALDFTTNEVMNIRGYADLQKVAADKKS